jgi:hypothetical protein
LSDDPQECFDLIARPTEADRIAVWRKRMIETLRTRPEGFSDGNRLISGRDYPGDGRQIERNCI